MPETTMQGVTLFSKERGRHSDAFELALTYKGIEIRRPGESARHLSWERISEWEIEQRRGGVLLTLRGGGAVTPLVIPRWKVDELDLVLRDVTSHAAELPTYPEAAPEPPTTVAAADIRAPEMPAPEAPPDMAVAAPPTPAAEVPEVAFAADVVAEVLAEVVAEALVDAELVPQPEAVVAVEAEPEAEPEPEPEPEVAAVEPEPELEPEPEPEPEPVVAAVELELEPEPETQPSSDAVIAESEPTDPEKHDSEEVAVSLIWPEDTPLEDFADLSWPVQSEDGERGGPTDIDVVLDPLPPSLPPVFARQLDADDSEAPSWAEWDNPPGSTDTRPQAAAPLPPLAPPTLPPAVRVVASEPTPVLEPEAPAAETPRVTPTAPSPTPTSGGSPPLLIHPVEGASLSTPRPVAAPRPATAPRGPSAPTAETTPRALRRRRARRKIPAKAVATVTLLALLATAVVLVLAQSAGAIHLGFLGTPG